jgi:TonB family protein
MTEIKNVTIEFNCPHTLDKNLYCSKCSHGVVDFRNKTDEELRIEIEKTKGPVCGVFKKSQLSDQFLKYAAATFIATSLAIPAPGQTPKAESLAKSVEKMDTTNEEDVFFGLVIETQAEPIGGYKELFETIKKNLQFPAGLREKGRSFVEFTIDTAGQMSAVKLVKGFNELADREAVRVISSLNHPFRPGRQGGKPVTTKLVIPIIFDPMGRKKS